ncbi:hypothetical protein [Saccharicrinis sp. FJH54]|uniref:hypothetical protein n=1 Tax=Saccharicrinis sp. FJH54 TaxID=3344665 RepID=UPI0035D411BB
MKALITLFITLLVLTSCSSWFEDTKITKNVMTEFIANSNDSTKIFYDGEQIKLIIHKLDNSAAAADTTDTNNWLAKIAIDSVFFKYTGDEVSAYTIKEYVTYNDNRTVYDTLTFYVTKNDTMICISSSRYSRYFIYSNGLLTKTYYSQITNPQKPENIYTYKFNSSGNLTEIMMLTDYKYLLNDYDDKTNPLNQINKILGFPYYDGVNWKSANNVLKIIAFYSKNQLRNIPPDTIYNSYVYYNNNVIEMNTSIVRNTLHGDSLVSIRDTQLGINFIYKDIVLE